MALIGISGKLQSGKNTVASIIQYLIAQPKLEKQGFNPSIELWLEDTLQLRNYESDWKQVAFAGKLKQIVSILTGIPVEDLEKQEVKERVLGEEWWYYKGETKLISYNEATEIQQRKLPLIKLTPRLLLQILGTDCGRDIIHPNIWINALFADIDKELDVNPDYNKKGFIITDVRFPNELNAIKQRGGKIIRVNRDRFRCSNCSELVLGRYNCQKCGTDQLIQENHSNHLSETALDDYQDWDYVINNNSDIPHLIKEVNKMLKHFKLI